MPASLDNDSGSPTALGPAGRLDDGAGNLLEDGKGGYWTENRRIECF